MSEQSPNSSKIVLKSRDPRRTLYSPRDPRIAFYSPRDPRKTPSSPRDPRKAPSSPRDDPLRNLQRKEESPVRLSPPSEELVDLKLPESWTCRNSACQASVSIDEKYCKRCSCSICHLFDDNKDPSLWLECEGESCGLTCHIECALKEGKAGVLYLEQLMHLDGSYCCASCGKVSEILSSWKKQLCIAREARRVDTLCYRIYLCYRLLDGTTRFKELHDIVKEAKATLETEVGPVNGAALMVRGIVSRLSVAGAVQSLCSLAIRKADDWLSKEYNAVSDYKEGSLPAACKIHFEEVTPISLVILLEDLSTEPSVDVKGYKLWCCMPGEDTYPKEPIGVFPKSQKRLWVSNLQPCKEYCFRIASYTESGDLGHFEAKCFTRSPESEEIILRSLCSVAGNLSKSISKSIPGFEVRDLGKILKICTQENIPKLKTVQEDRNTPSCQLDLNVPLIPDLNAEVTPESSRDERYNACTQNTVDVEDAVSKDNEGNCVGSGDSQGVFNSQLARGTKRAASTTNGETLDCNSALLGGSPTRALNRSRMLDESFEHCVKTIRWLECEGHIKNDFRLRFLSWFSLRSTERERRVVNAYIKTLIDDPSSLAEQLVHSFSEIISSKRPNTGFCSTLWH